MTKFRIGHLGNFGQTNSNMDEEAIGHAFEELGHEVYRLRESRSRYISEFDRLKCDFVLFHKFSDIGILQRSELPKVFWYFDRVDHPGDPSIEGRNRTRRQWMARMTPAVDVGFCTDGDWVSQDTSGKLHWLPQGADSRLVGIGTPPDGETHPPILFTGIGSGGGRKRESFVAEMRSVWGDSFHHVTSGYYGERLKSLIAASKVVVCPDSPVSDRYWSNRVYLAAGFGACVVHPWCERLAEHYEHGEEIFFYRSRKELHDIINGVLLGDCDSEAAAVAYLGWHRRELVLGRALARTKFQHTYTHRCAELVRVVKERLF